MTWMRVLLTWLAMAVAMSLNGVLRETLLLKLAGRKRADVASAAIGIQLILAISQRGLRGVPASARPQPGTVSKLWLFLTLCFEFGVGRFVDHKSWSELFGNYAIWRGRLWPVVLLHVVLAPFLWLRWLPSRRGASFVEDARA